VLCTRLQHPTARSPLGFHATSVQIPPDPCWLHCTQNGLPAKNLPQVPSPANLPTELFYHSATIDYAHPSGFTLRYQSNAEGAYSTGPIVAGNEMVFQRTRFTIGCPAADPPAGASWGNSCTVGSSRASWLWPSPCRRLWGVCFQMSGQNHQELDPLTVPWHLRTVGVAYREAWPTQIRRRDVLGGVGCTGGGWLWRCGGAGCVSQLAPARVRRDAWLVVQAPVNLPLLHRHQHHYRKSTNSKANLPTPTLWHKVLHQ
jgi:hypothetical protein